jgi:REP element-mobilizing transposase RayT
MTTTRHSYHRHSIRLKGYDYSRPGAYFVTLVCSGYKCLFGNIFDQEMQLNDIGKLAQKCWLKIPDHFPGTEVEPFVIMPNHMHGVITIFTDDRRGTIYRAPTLEEFSQPVAGSIPTIIRTYKAGVSRQVKRELGMVNIWQRNYYEHVIRNEIEISDIAGYILTNPESWAHDPKYTRDPSS